MFILLKYTYTYQHSTHTKRSMVELDTSADDAPESKNRSPPTLEHFCFASVIKSTNNLLAQDFSPRRDDHMNTMLVWATKLEDNCNSTYVQQVLEICSQYFKEQYPQNMQKAIVQYVMQVTLPEMVPAISYCYHSSSCKSYTIICSRNKLRISESSFTSLCRISSG